MSRIAKSGRGVRPNEMTSGTYQEHTRGQSNGGRSLYNEHLAIYQQELADERARGEHDAAIR